MTFLYKVSKQWLLVPLKPASYIYYVYIVRSPSATFGGSSTQHEEDETAATGNFTEPLQVQEIWLPGERQDTSNYLDVVDR